MSALLQLRSANSGAPFVGENDGDTVLWDAAHRLWRTGPIAGGVTSVFGRTGAVTAQSGDYDSDQVDNLSAVPGSSVSDALDYLSTHSGAVSSVFGRTGAVTAQSGDYNTNQVTPGAAAPDGTTLVNHGGALVGIGPLSQNVATTATVDPGTSKVGTYFLADAAAGSPVLTLADATGKTAGFTVSLVVAASSGAGRWVVKDAGANVLFTQFDATGNLGDVQWNGTAWGTPISWKFKQA